MLSPFLVPSENVSFDEQRIEFAMGTAVEPSRDAPNRSERSQQGLLEPSNLDSPAPIAMNRDDAEMLHMRAKKARRVRTATYSLNRSDGGGRTGRRGDCTSLIVEA